MTTPTTIPTTRILRFEVPVDDRWHLLQVPVGAILHVDCRISSLVEFWIRENEHRADEVRAFRAYGTGQPAPVSATFEGTALAPGGRLVWHLMSASTVPPMEVAL
jgi:hypothetical protein